MISILLQRTVCPRCGVPQFFPPELNVPSFVACINRGFQGPTWYGGTERGEYVPPHVKILVPPCDLSYATHGNLQMVTLTHDEERAAPGEVLKDWKRPFTTRKGMASLPGPLAESLGEGTVGWLRDHADLDTRPHLPIGETVQ